jgi:NitT/TauT family transport system substrate-binding protein
MGAIPDLAAETGIDVSAIAESVGFPATREPMLKGTAAITGFVSSTLNLKKRLGVPAEDISVLLMADYGVDPYGKTTIVPLAQANPELCSALLSAVAMGWKDATHLMLLLRP